MKIVNRLLGWNEANKGNWRWKLKKKFWKKDWKVKNGPPCENKNHFKYSEFNGSCIKIKIAYLVEANMFFKLCYVTVQYQKKITSTYSNYLNLKLDSTDSVIYNLQTHKNRINYYVPSLYNKMGIFMVMVIAHSTDSLICQM